jgi:hypothetical protein
VGVIRGLGVRVISLISPAQRAGRRRVSNHCCILVQSIDTMFSIFEDTGRQTIPVTTAESKSRKHDTRPRKRILSSADINKQPQIASQLPVSKTSRLSGATDAITLGSDTSRDLTADKPVVASQADQSLNSASPVCDASVQTASVYGSAELILDREACQNCTPAVGALREYIGTPVP